MRHKELFKTYVWLVETVFRHGPISLEEIGKRWEQSSLFDGTPLARTSFNRHREEIEDVFGIRIVCDRSNSWRYSIENASDLERNSVQSWMANTLSLNNVIADNRAVHDRILIETIPSEGETLQKAIEAMKLSRMVRIEYRKYMSAESRRFEVEPFCVKLYNRRWYILIRFPDDKVFRILSFDRIVGIEIMKRKFRMPARFNAADFFRDFFGIYYDPEIPLERIILRAYGSEQFYVRDLPLHPSQRKIGEGEGYSDFEVKLRPTVDFKGHLLSRGQWLRVIEPQALANEIAEWHRCALEIPKDSY